MDKFQTIQIFVAVAERGSFSGAARKLDISAAAITKNIARLEDHLGVQLFTRTTRKVAVTPYGQAFFERCSAILEDLAEAEASIRDLSDRTSGRVSIVMPYSFGRVTFVPELPRFHEKHPDVELIVHFNDDPVDLIGEGYDLAVRSRHLSDSGLIRRVLHRGPMRTVASPAYLEQHGMVTVPQDLTQHNCVISKYGSQWEYSDGNGGTMLVPVHGSIHLYSGDAVREAAVAGLGIARSTHWLFRKDLESGALKPLLSQYEHEEVPISVLFPSNRHLTKEVLAVIQFLQEITQEDG